MNRLAVAEKNGTARSLRIAALACLAAAGALLAPLTVRAADISIDNLTVGWTPGNKGINLAWDSVDASTDLAVVTYWLYGKAGYITSTTTLVNPANLIGVTLNTSGLTGAGATRAFSYVVVASDSINGLVDVSPVKFNHPIHYTLSPVADDIIRKDAAGGQDGQGPIWNFDYKLQEDYYMDIYIYPPGTVFTKNASGFVTTNGSGRVTGASLPPVKMVLDNTPRSDQMASDVYLNHDAWDSRDSSGAVVAKGMYTALFVARDALTDTQVQDMLLKTIPMDSIRITNVAASAITDTNASSLIAFNTNADCRAKALICKPGTKFTLATASGTLTYLTSFTYAYDIGDNLPLDPTTLAVDATRILKVLDFYIDNGDHAFPWAGTDENGTILASENYPFALSATDSFGNYATEVIGNDYTQWGNVSINRAASQPLGVIIANVFPASGAVLSASLNKIYASFGLVSNKVQLDPDRSTIVLTRPDGTPVRGAKRWDAAAMQMEYDLDAPLDQPGTYTMTVKARGTIIGQSEFENQVVTSFMVQLPNTFAESYLSPNPVKGVSTASFNVALALASDVRLRIFDMLGREVYDKTLSLPSGQQSLIWDLKNTDGRKLSSGVYIYKLEASNASGKQEIKKKFVVIQ